MPDHRDPTIRELIYKLAEASPAPPVLDLDVPNSSHSGRVTARRTERRRPRRLVAFVAAAAISLLLIGGTNLITLWLTSPDEPVTGVVPLIPPPLTIDSTTTSPPSEPAAELPVITWERIDAPGAFDLHQGLGQSVLGDPPVPGQQIEAILAVPDCPDGPTCGQVAGFVAGGHIGIQESEWDAAIWVSPDGQDWTAVEGPGFSDEGGQRILGLATDGGRVVAVGMFSMGTFRSQPPDRALVWYSDDLGHTWTPVEEPSFATGFGGMMDVAWTGDAFIGVGNGFWFSPDGLSWTSVSDEEPPVLVRSLVAWGTSWVAVGDGRDGSEAAMWRSDDGRSWDLVHADSGRGTDPIAGALTVITGADGLVAAGFEGPERRDRVPAVWRSEDGSAWQRGPVIPWDETTLRLYEPIEGLARIGDWMLAIGNSWDRFGRGRPFMLASADDGLNWVNVPLDPNTFDLEFSAASPGSPSDVLRSNGGGAGFATIEVMPIPASGTSDTVRRIVVAGSNRTDAAIWVGTVGE